MPELIWEPLDFYTVLEVEPETDEYQLKYTYDVEREAEILQVRVWPLYSSIEVEWSFTEPRPLHFSWTFYVRGGAVRVRQKEAGEYLLWRDVILVPHPRRSYASLFGGKQPPGELLSMDVSLRIKPQIDLRFETP